MTLALPTGLPQEAVEFFCLFARFEYALKRARFLKNSNGAAEADWKKFFNAPCMAALLAKTRCHPEVEYLISHPPKMQWAENDVLGWKASNQIRTSADLVRAVKTVRNNLFHGGKWPLPVGPVDGSERDAQLLRAGIIVLKAALLECSEVRDAYETW